MAPNKTGRCRYCGGTLWRDADIVKCFMCSRPADGSVGVGWMASATSNTGKLPGAPWKNAGRQAK